MSIINISSGNKSLNFIHERIKDKKYRGQHSSQHNRYTMDRIVKILNLLNKYIPNKKLMIIRTTDISKRPENLPEEFIYAQFCNEVKKNIGIGTQDAMRKNLFVDLHRMGLINRHDKNENKILPFRRKSIKYVSITKQGLKLIDAKNITEQYFIYSKGIDILLGGHINTILDILRNEEYSIDSINIYEYMFFISAIATETIYTINVIEAVELIKEYRILTDIQRKAVIETLKKELKPNNFKGTKIEKRDFHNWKNESDQIFYLLNQTIYFEIRKEKLLLSQKKDKELNQLIESKRLNRSLNEKYLYFKNHDVIKTNGFELHHVVPLSWSESIYHFKMLDKWKNLIYIDGFNHAKITHNNNRNVVMEIENDDLILKDFSEYKIYLKFEENILYDPKHKNEMKKYNDTLIKSELKII